MKIVHLENILQNYLYLKKNHQKKIYAVLKSDAYNHGLRPVARVLYRNGCEQFCVIEEADCKMIRRECKRAEILLMNPFPHDLKRIKKLIARDVTFTVGKIEDLYFLSKISKKIKIQIELKSFMNRFGIDKTEFLKFIQLIQSFSQFKLTGIYSHLCSSYINQPDLYEREMTYLKELMPLYFQNIDWHFASSEGNKDDLSFGNAIRVGINLYDYAPTMEVTGKIIQINRIKKGESVSYFNDYIAEEDTFIGICNLGYYDGILKKYKNQSVFIRQKFYKIVGNVCMNVCFIQIDSSVKVNDEVEFLGEHIPLKDLSEKFSMSKHEILLNYK